LREFGRLDQVNQGSGLPQMLNALVDGIRWAAVVIWVLAATEKANALARGAASWHPLILVSHWRRRHARALFTLALGADLLTLLLLVLAPRLGGAVSACLIVLYTRASSSARPGIAEGCRCFWKILDAHSPQALVMRNALLVVLSAAIGLAPPHASWPDVLLAVLVVAVIASVTRRVDQYQVVDPSLAVMGQGGRNGG
jgi:hypothetical protein